MMYSCGLLHMDEQRQDDHLEPTYNSSVSIRDVSLKTSRKRWTIEKGGGRGLGISVLMARHDDDDDDLSRITIPDMIEKQGIVNLGSSSCKSYDSVILNVTEVSFLRKADNTAFRTCLNCFC